MNNEEPMKKYIHYCWFGGKPLPKLAKQCIESWKKYLPDYEIICWNEKNFDVNSTPFSKSAYEAGKWAFVSDVARVCALREMGGIYFDTDMMVTADVSEIVKNDFFAGWEDRNHVNAAVLGVNRVEHPAILMLYDYYANHVLDLDHLMMQSIPRLLTQILKRRFDLKRGHLKTQKLADGIVVYSRDYFYPISADNTADLYTENTCMVHYFSGSWLPDNQKAGSKVKHTLKGTYGTAVLDWLIASKRALRATAKVVLYPVVKHRREGIEKRESGERIERYRDLLNEIPSGEYVVFYHNHWIGTSVVTKEMFDYTIGITELKEDDFLDFLAEELVAKQLKMIAFSAFAFGWDALIKRIKLKDENVVIKVIWHGGNALNVEDYDWIVFMKVIELVELGLVEKIAFIKKSMFEFYKAKNYPVEFLMNTLSLEKNKYCKDPHGSETKRRIGIYASEDRWVKNFYNQLAAASMIEDVKVNCTPLSVKTTEFAGIIDLEIEGNEIAVSRDELLSQMSQNELNLYVTFTECAPLIPLESLELGVPCLTGNNHHYWEGTELENYLVVQEADNVMKIHEKIKFCIENREKILDLYKEWKTQYDIEARSNKDSFIQN